MALLTYIGPDEPFPDTAEALSYPDGLLAVSDDLTADRLISAYSRGIFPWFEDPQPVLWWSPDPRSVLFPDALRISRSLRRTLKRNRYRLSVDRCFSSVMRACGQPRAGQSGTWINDRMLSAYAQLHELGHAHSIEAWNEQEELVGGLYGICLGSVFFGESMFSLSPDASKVAFVGLVDILRRGSGTMIDCQVRSEHLDTLGAQCISRVDFESHLKQTTGDSMAREVWQVPASTGDLA